MQKYIYIYISLGFHFNVDSSVLPNLLGGLFSQAPAAGRNGNAPARCCDGASENDGHEWGANMVLSLEGNGEYVYCIIDYLMTLHFVYW